MLTEVIVKLTPAAASAEPARRSVDACAANLGVKLTRLHPSTADSELSTYFATQVDAAAVDRVVERLLACEGVEGAYRKPRGEPPRRR